MKIRVLHDFKDKEHNLKYRSAGEQLTVSKERAEHLIRIGLAEAVEENEGDPKESPVETQG